MADNLIPVRTIEEFYLPDNIASLHPNNFPEVLYKYRGWGSSADREDLFAFHRRLLNNNELSFPCVTSFNDPYDSRIPVRFDLTSDRFMAKWRQHLYQSAIADGILREKGARKYYKSQLSALKPHDIMENIRESVIRHSGICSFSSSRDNLLMWGHYGACHKGVCIGFDAKELLSYLHQQSIPSKIFRFYHAQVSYVSDIPVINPENGMEDNKMMEVFCYKNIDWKYEREHRIILNSSANFGPIYPGKVQIRTIKDSHFKEVIVGSHSPYLSQILEIVKRKSVQIKVYRAHMNTTKFELMLEPVSY